MTAEEIIERANTKRLPLASAYLFGKICHTTPHTEKWTKLMTRYHEIQEQREQEQALAEQPQQQRRTL